VTGKEVEEGRGTELVDGSADAAATSRPAEAGATSRPLPRPRPGPTPTSRARRAAAAGVQPAAARPAPGPRSAAAVAEPAPAGTSAVRSSGPVRAEPAEIEGAKPAGTGPGAEPARTSYRVRADAPRWLAVLLAVSAAVLAGISGWLVVAAPGAGGSVGQRDQALSSAKTSVALILSYDYRTFDAGVAKARAQLTGRANTDYVQAMTSTIKPAAEKSKVVVQAQTESAGVETVSADGKQVTVVVFGQQKVTNTALTAPRIDPFRVRATLSLVGGHWLVSKFDQI
jgi:Mce-associated membrane protein